MPYGDPRSHPATRSLSAYSAMAAAPASPPGLADFQARLGDAMGATSAEDRLQKLVACQEMVLYQNPGLMEMCLREFLFCAGCGGAPLGFSCSFRGLLTPWMQRNFVAWHFKWTSLKKSGTLWCDY